MPAMDPGNVAPMVAYLAHESCQVSGEVYVAGGGRFARLFVGGHGRLPAPGHLNGATHRRRGGQLGGDQRRDRLLRAERPDGLGRPLHGPPEGGVTGMGILAGKTALVTGASSGYRPRLPRLPSPRRGLRWRWWPAGATRLADLASQIEAGGGKALARAADVTEEHNATQAVEDAVGHFGGLDILVNAAGLMTQVGKVENGDTGDWRYVFELNFWAGFYTSRAAIPALKAGGGDIVNISSTAGRRAVGATFGPYAASKFALTAFNESLRAEVTLAGIRVCIIEPGATRHRDPRAHQGREGPRVHQESRGEGRGDAAGGRRRRHHLRGQPAAPG